MISKKAAQEDLVLIYYSGHGLLDGNCELYLAGRDTETATRSTHVEFEHDIAKVLKDQKRAVVLLDCCYSGATASNRQGVVEFKGSITNEIKTAVKFTGGSTSCPRRRARAFWMTPAKGCS